VRRRFVSVASLLLCFVTAVLWVRSWSHSDLARLNVPPNKEFSLMSEGGAIRLRFAVFPRGQITGRLEYINVSKLEIPLFMDEYPMSFDTSSRPGWAIGIDYNENQGSGFQIVGPAFKYHLVVIPYWIIFTVAVLLILPRLIRRTHPSPSASCTHSLFPRSSSK